MIYDKSNNQYTSYREKQHIVFHNIHINSNIIAHLTQNQSFGSHSH